MSQAEPSVALDEQVRGLLSLIHTLEEHASADPARSAALQATLPALHDALDLLRAAQRQLAPLEAARTDPGSGEPIGDSTTPRAPDGPRAASRLQLAIMRESEHDRLARDLHDTIVQHLVGLHYRLLQEPVSQGQQEDKAPLLQEVKEQLRRVDQGILTILGEVRTLIRRLRPPGLDEFGLSVALEGLVSQLTRQADDPPTVSLDLQLDEERLPRHMKVLLFRVAEEGLTNAIRHAGAEQVSLALSQQGNNVSLTISDNGRGFEPPEQPPALMETKRFGLLRMAEYVEVLGGDFLIQSGDQQGTRINAVLPLL